MKNLSATAIILALAISLTQVGCGTLKQPEETPPSATLPPASQGLLASTSEKVSGEAQSSAFDLLDGAKEALNWRLALADHATRSLDVQYFIWQGDAAGTLLFLRLLEAADRGVRVRLLVDDLAITAKDKDLAAVCQHPNFEIRIFNPNAARNSAVGAVLNFGLHFRELNRRMHNKLFVADNRMAIVGGRNIGDEYFGLSEKYNFRDLDLLVAGEVVSDISNAFDSYWNSSNAVPVKSISRSSGIGKLPKIRHEMIDFLNDQKELLAAYPIQRRSWKRELARFARTSHQGTADFLQDRPEPGDTDEVKLTDMIVHMAEPSDKELLMVTPYLIPVDGFLENIAEAEKEGVQVTIVTGSMESNNHTVAHSHYKKYRKPVLATGADLYEYRGWPGDDQRVLVDVPPVDAKYVALHFKTLVGDRKRCFIGSLNLDPRAMIINSENGLLIESAPLAAELAAKIDAMRTPENAWKVSIDSDGRLRYISSAGVREVQPARGVGQRIADFFFRLLPIESQL